MVPPNARKPGPRGKSTPENTADTSAWLVLVYRIPSEPSRLRATAWRRIRGYGAIYLQNSVAALPFSPANERAFRTLRAEIGDLGGTAVLFRADTLAGSADLVAAYNAARDDEYEEVIDKCRDFLAEIDKETAAGHVTYAELEENEEDLTKLHRWLDKVVARDTLHAAGAPAARDALQQCESSLEKFAHLVYAADDDGA